MVRWPAVLHAGRPRVRYPSRLQRRLTTVAGVAIKTRIDNQVVGIHFIDGARVKQGDLLVTLDSRLLEAHYQIAQPEANLARDRAQLEGAERDLRRGSELTSKGAGPQINVDNFKTQVDMYTAAVKANLGVLENLKGSIELLHHPRTD